MREIVNPTQDKSLDTVTTDLDWLLQKVNNSSTSLVNLTDADINFLKYLISTASTAGTLFIMFSTISLSTDAFAREETSAVEKIATWPFESEKPPFENPTLLSLALTGYILSGIALMLSIICTAGCIFSKLNKGHAIIKKEHLDNLKDLLAWLKDNDLVPDIDATIENFLFSEAIEYQNKRNYIKIVQLIKQDIQKIIDNPTPANIEAQSKINWQFYPKRRDESAELLSLNTLRS